MRDTMESLCQLWKIMDSSEEEKRQFSKVISILITPEEGITSCGVLSQETIEKVSPARLCFLLFNRFVCCLP
jgi:protein regulator of cytokinesis 1